LHSHSSEINWQHKSFNIAIKYYVVSFQLSELAQWSQKHLFATRHPCIYTGDVADEV